MTNILVVDDDDAVRGLMAAFLRAEGHEVTEANSGMGVLEMHSATPFDLIVLDIIMPEKEGLETLMEFRHAASSMPPILAVSGGGDKGLLDFLPVAERMGAAETLRKPFDRDQFLGACRRLLANGG